MLTDLGMVREAVRNMVHPALRDVLDDVQRVDRRPARWRHATPGHEDRSAQLAQRVYNSSGQVVGTTFIYEPAVGTTTVAMLTAAGDLDHFHRMQQFAPAGRRPAAVLFADLEGSTQLSKQLSTATFFTLIRRIARVRQINAS